MADDVHTLDPADFVRQVHSFQHWFDSVEGYLHDLDHGHRPDLVAGPLEEGERERLITTLASYCVGETAALEASSGLIRLAPNHLAKVFLSTQVVDEGRHVEVILHRMAELGVEDPEAETERRAGASIRRFRQRLLDQVEAREWDAAIFVQNVLLEAMEFTVFQSHARVADPVTRDLLERIVKDERRHIGFGENELGRRLRGDRRLQERIARLRAEFDPLVLETFEHALEELRIPRRERPELGRGYLQAVARLGFE